MELKNLQEATLSPELVLRLMHAVVDDMHHFCAYICQETVAILQ